MVTFLRLGSARSSSSSCHAAPLVWAEKPTALLYNTCSPRLLGWPLRLGESLPLWNSKDKKCCLYKMPYAAAPMRVLGGIIARTKPYVQLPTDAPTREPDFFGSRVTCFWGDPSHHIKTPTFIFYKEVYKQKWYQKWLLITLKESHAEYLQVSLQGYSVLTWGHEHEPKETQHSRWPSKMGTEQSAPTHAHHTHCAPRQLGMTADWRYDIPWDWVWDSCLQARVHWGNGCKEFCSEEGSHYHIEQSAMNPLEHDQVQRVLRKLSRSWHKTSNNQPWFTSSEIPWWFLARAVMCWLRRGLCHARKCQLKDIMWKEKVWFAIAQRTFAWEIFGKRQKWERIPAVSLLPGSHKCLASRKRMMCARNLGVHVRCSTLESQRYEKTG